MMPRLSLALFGSFAIARLESDKVRGLLARLALYGQMQDRDGQADCLLIVSAAAQGRGDRAAAWQALEQAEALIRASENGFRAARALCRRAELVLQEGKIAQARALLEATLRHPACEHYVREHAARRMGHG